MEETKLKIKGMHCKSCVLLITDALEELGIKDSQIDSKTGTATIRFDGKKLTLEKIKEVIKKEGYQVEQK